MVLHLINAARGFDDKREFEVDRCRAFRGGNRLCERRERDSSADYPKMKCNDRVAGMPIIDKLIIRRCDPVDREDC